MERIKEAGHQVELHQTQAEGHGMELAMMARHGDSDVIVAIGGDGTVNEVAHALVGSKKILGIIPNGSGNGLARELRIPMDISKAIAVLLQHQVATIDTCEANGEPFFVTCGSGFDGKVSTEFATSDTRGLLTYAKETLTLFRKYEPAQYHITIDGKEFEKRAFLVAVANASQYGNNAFIAPTASMSDGILDVTIIEPFSQIDAPKLLVQLFSKEITSNDNVTSLRGKEITITSSKPTPYHMDGEPKSAVNQLHITVIPKSLNVVCGSEKDREKNIIDYFKSLTNTFTDFADDVKQIFK